ncbi:MAG: hypothetical protein RIR69_1660 [Actinomycetota bacterium]|jgi:hypothetical protein
MSTRKLILTALICGLAIMLAGGVKLFQVANDSTEVVVHSLGVEQTLSDMTVTVKKVEQSEMATSVTVVMFGVANGDPIEGWRLLANGKVLSPTIMQSEQCPPTAVDDVVECVVEFPGSDGSVTVAYLRAGQQSQWAP